MSYRVASAAIAAILLTTPAPAAQQNLGLVTWSSFECATYASEAGMESEQKRLFELGYRTGTDFIEGIQKETIPEEEIKKAPLALLMLLSGPSNEFMLGRIYENVSGMAYDKITKRDETGYPLAPENWIADSRIIKSIAETKYRTRNCALIDLN